jgi:hypothetical protein
VWPTARPAITVEPGERLSFSVRIKPVSVDAGELKLASSQPAKATSNLRRETDGSYWLDVLVGPVTEPGTHVVPFVLEAGAGGQSLKIELMISVPAENVVFTPKSLDLGRVSLASLKSGMQKSGRLGVRKLVGSFRIKSLTSTLAFLKLDQQVMVEGSNYLIKVTFNLSNLPKAGDYSGVLRIETDDSLSPRLEVPIKLTVVEQ